MKKESMQRLVKGDAMVKLRSVKTESAQLVLTDPPYGIGYTSRTGVRIKNDEHPFIWWMHDAFRICKPGGGILCFTRWDIQDSFKLALESAGFKIRSQIVWDKGGGGKGDLRAQFSPRHELIWWATKGRFAFPDKRPMSVFPIAKPSNHKRTHPTEKPVELLCQLINATTRSGDLVVDPFSGTGSCGVASTLCGRRFFGVELNAKYAMIARRRIASARGNTYDGSRKSTEF
ncbi:MAG: hypothetical protein JJ916_10505 [Phycisphaerales bacterium]|nr:hypothetical protein [Phycisphaerales bacterium]